MYLLGVNLPDEKIVPVALSRIYGVGIQEGSLICDKLQIHRKCRLSDVPESKIIELSRLLNTMTIESELRRKVKDNIATLARIECYRGKDKKVISGIGKRHMECLPVRGQNTRTNCKTAKRMNGRQFGLKGRTFST
jgi:small subunit ribosomal protein S13